MRTTLVLLAALAGTLPAPSADAAHHRRHLRRAPLPVDVAPAPIDPGASAGPLAGLPLIGSVVGPLTAPLTVPLAAVAPPPAAGRPIPPEAARFMGYPYNVPGYRYVGYDGCLLRVGGIFGPGPSAAPCPFGLDRAF